MGNADGGRRTSDVGRRTNYVASIMQFSTWAAYYSYDTVGTRRNSKGRGRKKILISIFSVYGFEFDLIER